MTLWSYRARAAIATAGLGLALAAAGCAAPARPGGPPGLAGLTVARGVAAREPAVSPRPLGTADTTFGLGVLGAWCRVNPDAKLMLSPSSLASGRCCRPWRRAAAARCRRRPRWPR
jgi:hypothetical protein